MTIDFILCFLTGSTAFKVIFQTKNQACVASVSIGGFVRFSQFHRAEINWDERETSSLCLYPRGQKAEKAQILKLKRLLRRLSKTQDETDISER